MKSANNFFKNRERPNSYAFVGIIYQSKNKVPQKFTKEMINTM